MCLGSMPALPVVPEAPLEASLSKNPGVNLENVSVALKSKQNHNTNKKQDRKIFSEEEHRRGI